MPRVAHSATRAGPVASPPISSSGPVTVTPTLNELTGMWRKPRNTRAARMIRRARYEAPNSTPVSATWRNPPTWPRWHRHRARSAMNRLHRPTAKMPTRSMGVSMSWVLAWMLVPTQAHQIGYEENQRSPHPGPRVIGMQEGGHLCDREHEDEVEEELGPGDPLFRALRVVRVAVIRHRCCSSHRGALAAATTPITTVTPYRRTAAASRLGAWRGHSNRRRSASGRD